MFPAALVTGALVKCWWCVTQAVDVRQMYGGFKGIDPVHQDCDMAMFVLDRTIWPFHIHKLNHSLADLNEIKPSDLGDLALYPEAHSCLDMLQKEGYVLAAICNCQVPQLAERLLDAFDLTRYFAYQVCDEEDRISPVETLHAQSSVDFEDMLYFDYHLRKNPQLSSLNVTSCPVGDQGITMETVEKATQRFSRRTTLKPPLSTTPKLKVFNDSSEYSLQIDYKNLDFKRPSTKEILEECCSDEENSKSE